MERREREGQREEEETEMKRMEGGGGGGLVFFCPTFSFFLFHCSIPHQWCNTGDLFIAGRKPSSPLVFSPLSFSLPPPSLPPSLLAQLTGWMHEWTGLSLSLLLLRWGRGDTGSCEADAEQERRRKEWWRREAGERVPIVSEWIGIDCWSHPLRVKPSLSSVCLGTRGRT